MEAGLYECPICQESFDMSERTPRIIPKCGHTICFACLDKIIKAASKKSKPKCPLCNAHQPKTIEEFPENYAVKQALAKKIEAETCQEHKKRIHFFCFSDKKKACRICLDGHEGHNFKDYDSTKDKVIKQTNKVKSCFEFAQKYRQDSEKILTENCSKKIKQFQEAFKEIRLMINQLESDLIVETATSFSAGKEIIETLIGENSKSIENLREKERILKNFFNPDESVVDPNFLFSSEEIDFKRVQEVGEQMKKLDSSLDLYLTKQKEIASELSLSYEEPVRKLLFPLNNANDQKLNHIHKFTMKSALSFYYNEQTKSLTITNGLYEERDIDFGLWVQAQTIYLEFYQGLNHEDSNILLCLGKRFENPSKLDIKIPNYVYFDEMHGAILAGPDTFSHICINFESFDNQKSPTSLDFYEKLLCKMKRLKKLRLSSTGGSYLPIEFSQKIVQKGIQQPKNIEIFESLLMDIDLNDKNLENMFIQMSNLRGLNVNFSGTQLTDIQVEKYVKRILASTKFLRKLHLNLANTHVTGEVLKIIFEGLASSEILEDFILNLNSIHLANQNFISFFKPLPNIKSFTMELSNTTIIDKTLEILMDKLSCSFKTIEKFSLNLSGTHITDLGIEKVLVKIQDVKFLRLDVRKTDVTERTLEFFLDKVLHRMNKLEYFEIPDWGKNVNQELKDRLCNYAQNYQKNCDKEIKMDKRE